MIMHINNSKLHENESFNNSMHICCYILLCFIHFYKDFLDCEALRDRGSVYLSNLFAHNGEYPEIQQELPEGWTLWRWRLEVHQQHIGKQKQEQEVHQDVAEEGGDRRVPELSPT